MNRFPRKFPLLHESQVTPMEKEKTINDFFLVPAVYKIKCCNCQATYISETSRNLEVRLTEQKRTTRNGDLNNNMNTIYRQTTELTGTLLNALHIVLITTNGSYWKAGLNTNLEQTPLHHCLQLPAPYKRLVDDINNGQTRD